MEGAGEVAGVDDARRYRTIFEQAAVGIAEVALDGRFVCANARMRAILGFAADEEAAASFLSFVHPSHHGRARALLRAVAAGRAEGASRELLCAQRGAAEVWMRVSASLARDGEGRPSVILLVAQDVTAQKKAQTKAAASQRLWRAAIENISEAVILYDAEDRLVACNSKFREIHPWVGEACKPGIHFKELARRGAEAGQYPEAEGRIEQWLERRMREHRDFQRTFLRRLGDGRWVQIRNRPTQDGGIVGLRADVSEFMRAREALAQSEERTRGIMQNVADGIVTIDERGRITSFNAAAERIFGYPVEEALGRNVNMLMSEPDRSAHDDHVRHYVGDGRPRVIGKGAREVIGLRKDGGSVDLELATSEMSSGGRRQFIGVLRDITQRKRVAAELQMAKNRAEEASLAKSRFLANMSHELRTPLNAVIGFSEILHSQMFGPLGSDKYVEYARDIHEGGRHLLGVINDILDIAKAEAGKMKIAAEPVDALEVVQECIRMMRDRAAAQQVAIGAEVRCRPAVLHGDRQKIAQILLNLLSNAVKFTPAGGRVAVELARPSERWIELTVADTGIGMAPEDVPRALEPFGQIDNALARRFEGTGLGLPLVKTLAELHGGGLRIVSAPGEGTTAVVRLPALVTGEGGRARLRLAQA